MIPSVRPSNGQGKFGTVLCLVGTRTGDGAGCEFGSSIVVGFMEMSGGDVTTIVRGTATGGGAGCEFVPPLTVVDLWETSGGAGCASCVR